MTIFLIKLNQKNKPFLLFRQIVIINMSKKINYIDIDLKQDHQVILLPGVAAYWDFKHPPNYTHF